MPSYNYLCESCGLLFDKTYKLGKNPLKLPCKACTDEAILQLSTDVGYEFEINSKGLDIQNTGVASLDYDYDTIIGNESKERWVDIERRDAYKRSLLSDTQGARKRDLMVIHSDDGEQKNYKLWNIQQKRALGRLRLETERVSKIKLT